MGQRHEPSAVSEYDVARSWDGNADRWAEQVRAGADPYREHFTTPAFLRFVGDLAGQDLLDAGCGEGYLARLLARRGARVVGVDLSPRMVALAREEERRAPLGVRYEVGSFADLSPFGVGSFDAVVAFMSLMDGPDLEGALSEFARVLRPGGRLAFAVLHPCFSTRGLGWQRDERGEVVGFTGARYFDPAPWVDHWRFRGVPEDVPPFSVPRFPRTLAAYLTGVVAAGFVLERVEEPRPDEAACEQHPFLQRWRDQAPLILMVRARRP